MGPDQELDFITAFKQTFANNYSEKLLSTQRLIRIDTLTESALFGEKTTQRNIAIIRNLLGQKFDDFKKWRKNNPIKSGDTIF